ncbi:MAG: SpoIIE family protein phosphatase, partial [Leptospiraceae bacterium]|nr:SpoIIE family protein phosphatase [Leptospiraceae bacterium]
SSDIVSERALRIIKVIDKRSSAEEEIVERFEIFEGREQEILSRLKPVIEQLKKRRVQLKKEKPRNPPGQDKEYSDLYSQYRELLQERERIVTDLFDKINPYRQQKEDLLLKQKDTKASLEQVKKDLADLLKQKKSLGKVKAESEEEKRAKELQLKIEELQTMIKNIGESLTGIAEEIKVAEYRLENWEYADAEFSPDAFRYLVDAALYENIILRFRYDASEHRKYLRSEKERASVRRAWGQIRTWVINGRSEIDFVAVDERGRYGRYRPLQNGILAKTRSEAEDIMWQLDQTPLRDLAASSLYKENFAGFIRFLADMGSYHNYFAEQRQKLLITTGSIGFVGLILSWLLATVFVSRIRNVSKRAVAVGIERDLTIRFPATGWDEITQLQNSLNNMLTDLRESEEVRAQMNAAGEVQRRLLPTTIPDKFISSVDISMFYHAMSNIGGDYYDFIEAADGKLAICIGDVSNHGVGPALIMSNLSAQIHLLVELGHSDPLVILEKLNDLLYRNTPEDMFVTFFMAFYDTASGDMTYCSAGHNDGDLIRANGKHEVIPGGGLPLGMDENDFFLPSLKTEKINLKKGDIFFHCTDGLIEAKNSDRKMFTIERVREILITSHEKDSASMLNDISASLEKFTETAGGLQNLEDDIAMFSVKRSK